jgi:hypothetical protein
MVNGLGKKMHATTQLTGHYYYMWQHTMSQLEYLGFVLTLLGIFGEVQKKERKKGKIVATDV